MKNFKKIIIFFKEECPFFDDRNNSLYHILTLRMLMGTIFLIGAGLVAFVVTPIGFILDILNLIFIELPKLFKLFLTKYFKTYFEEKHKNKVKKTIQKHYESIRVNDYKLTSVDKQKKFVRTDYTVNEFILNFVDIYNNNYLTIDKFGGLICDTGRRRSLGDIFLICKHYYPDVTMEQVLVILLNYCDNWKISCSYCNTIKKLVFFKYDHRRNYTDVNSNTEYGNIKLLDVITAYTDQLAEPKCYGALKLKRL